MRKSILVLLCIFFPLALISCGQKEGKEAMSLCPDLHLDVERVFWHEGNWYSFLVRGKDGHMSMRNIGVIADKATVEIFDDVPSARSMFADASDPVYYQDGSRCERRHLMIHVHNVSEIDGGTWNHGKNGHGSTTVIK